MDHVLTVGEIYDEAVDLCVRNAGKIALSCGVYSLVSGAVNVFYNNSQDQDYSMLRSLHLRQHALGTANPWSNWFEALATFVVLPIVVAALFSIFDRARHSETFSIRDSFRSSFRRSANVVVAAVLTQIYAGAPGLAIAVLYFRTVPSWHQFGIDVLLGVVAIGIIVWVTGLLALGVALGFARVALDAGRVIESLRFGTTYVFARQNRRKSLAVGVPLALIVILGNFGGTYAGVLAYGLTGSDVAMVLVESLGEVAAWSILAAVTTVYYRTLVPAI